MPAKRRRPERSVPAPTQPDPKRDPGGQWERQIRAIAAARKIDATTLVEEWDERAAVREYLGNVSRDEANARAFEDVRDRFQTRELF